MATEAVASHAGRPPTESATTSKPRKGFEFVNGQFREMTANAQASYIGGKLFSRLADHAERQGAGWVFPPGTSYQCFPDDQTRYRRPSVSYISMIRLSPATFETVEHLPIAPDIVAEVVSPFDLATEVNSRFLDWVDAQVKLVWLIHPSVAQVHCFNRDHPHRLAVLGEADTLTGDPVLPGFAVPVAELFRLPVSQPPAG